MIIKVIFTVLVMSFLIITAGINHKDKIDLGNKTLMENNTLVESYPAQAEGYLETKYGEEFRIDPNYDSQQSPSGAYDPYSPYIYKVREKGGDQYMFRTYVYPMGANDKSLRSMDDGYYWKTIEKETKGFMEDKMQSLLPKEYKMLFLADPSVTFETASLSLPMETYFSIYRHQASFKLYIIAPPKEDMQVELLTKESVYPILNDFHKLNNNQVRIQLIYGRAVSEDDYRRMDIDQFETSVYMHADEYQKIWDSVRWVSELKVETE